MAQGGGLDDCRGERATARRQRDDAEAPLRTALSTAQEIGSPAQLWKTHGHSRGCMPVRVRPTNPSAPGGRPVTSSRASGSAYRIPDSVRASQFSSDRHSPDDASLGWTGLMFASRGRQAKTSITDEDLGTTRLALGVTGRRPPRSYPGITQEVAPQREPKSPKADDVRSANLRGVLCGALAPVLV